MGRVALALAIAASLAGCAASSTPTERGKKVSYNRREVLPGSPGVFTGPDGVWTAYRSGGEPRKDAGPKAKSETCPDGTAGPDGACPEPHPTPTVLLPAP